MSETLDTAATTWGDPQPTLRECIWVSCGTAVMLLLNLATCHLYPEVWCDEVWFSEPAVNWVLYGKFETMVGQYQPPHTFPTVNCPLYLMALVPWLKWFGTSVLAIRSLNYVLLASAGLLLWAISWRWRLVRPAWMRVLLVLVLPMSYGLSFAYRCSRPDMLGMTCVLLLASACGLRNSRLRWVAVMVLSATATWIGLQVALLAGFGIVAAWYFFEEVTWKEVAFTFLGTILGAATMCLLFSQQGVLQHYLPVVVGMMGRHYAHAQAMGLVEKLHRVVANSATAYVEDFTTLVLTLALFLIFFLVWRRLASRTRTVGLFCLALAFCVPALFNIVGHYAFYYSYARVAPLTLLFFVALSDLLGSQPRDLRYRLAATAAWIGLAGGVLLGLPLRLGLTLAACQVAPRSQILSLMRNHLRPSDVVLCDYAYFFEAKQVAAKVYDRFSTQTLLQTPIPGREFSEGEKNSFTTLVIRPNEAELLTNYLGGSWTAASPPFGDSQDYSVFTRLPWVGDRIANYSRKRQTERYQLQIFRRAPARENASIRPGE